MLNAQFDGDLLMLRPSGPITREDVAALTRMADEYLAGHAKISGVMVQTQKFPGFASIGAFADYARFIADHRARVRRVALVTDSALAPVAEKAGANCSIDQSVPRVAAGPSMWVRSGGFFGDDDPPETPPFSIEMAVLLVLLSASVAARVLIARVFLLAVGPARRSWDDNPLPTGEGRGHGGQIEL